MADLYEDEVAPVVWVVVGCCLDDPSPEADTRVECRAVEFADHVLAVLIRGDSDTGGEGCYQNALHIILARWGSGSGVGMVWVSNRNQPGKFVKVDEVRALSNVVSQ